MLCTWVYKPYVLRIHVVPARDMICYVLGCINLMFDVCM